VLSKRKVIPRSPPPKVSPQIESRLVAMFECDREDQRYYYWHPAYSIDWELGAMPWWPPLSRVWRLQGIPPKGENRKVKARWAEAWELLQRYHKSYLEAKR